jgi:hypothetical protein
MRDGASSTRFHTSHRRNSSVISDKTVMSDFSHAENGMTRFPPNIEQLSVQRDSTVTWLIARRNEIELRFPLKEEDRRHLARLILGDLFLSPHKQG